MNRALKQAVEAALTTSVGSPSEPQEVVDVGTVSGGCIHDAYLVRMRDGGRYFVKSNPSAPPDMFGTEAAGLNAIAETNTIATPRVIAVARRDNDQQFLILQHIPSHPAAANFPELFGRQLASLHRHGRSEAFGFDHNNYLGATVQPNDWTDRWPDFWRRQRLEWQFSLAWKNGHGDAMTGLTEPLIRRVGKLLGDGDPPPALIHGDLWSGNYLVASAGQPVLIDPAVYYGDREAEFGMITLFGGLNSRFYDSYQEAFPLLEGWEERVEIYRLYHLLNHLNLFGTSYLESCLMIMKKWA